MSRGKLPYAWKCYKDSDFIGEECPECNSELRIRKAGEKEGRWKCFCGCGWSEDIRYFLKLERGEIKPNTAEENMWHPEEDTGVAMPEIGILAVANNYSGILPDGFVLMSKESPLIFERYHER